MSMIVTAAPPDDLMVMFLPPVSMLKLPVPAYVPSATSTVSPFKAALTPAWMVDWLPGALTTAARRDTGMINAAIVAITAQPRAVQNRKPQKCAVMLELGCFCQQRHHR